MASLLFEGGSQRPAGANNRLKEVLSGPRTGLSEVVKRGSGLLSDRIQLWGGMNGAGHSCE